MQNRRRSKNSHRRRTPTKGPTNAYPAHGRREKVAAKHTVYYRVKGENLRLVFVVKIHGSPLTREILLDS